MKPTNLIGMGSAMASLLIFVAASADAQRGGRGGGGRPQASSAQRGGGGGANRQVRASSGSSIQSASRGNSNVNRGSNRTASNNVNRSGNRVNNGNINTGDVNIDVDGGCCNGGYGYGYHPVARGAAIATTAAVMGSYYSALPSGCVTVVRVGINYSRCGSVWYQPVYSGANVQYMVVGEP